MSVHKHSCAKVYKAAAMMKGGSEMKKRFLSLLLILCMVLTVLPVSVFAEGESAANKAGDAAFTLSADKYSCADSHTGEISDLTIKSVDISGWNKKRR